jgi:hypothetical protein
LKAVWIGVCFSAKGRGIMKNRAAVALCALAVVPWFAPGVADAQPLACGPNRTIGQSLKKLKPGETLLVSGVCNENLTITEEVLNVVIDGQGSAAIRAVDPAENAVNIRGRGVTLQGFTVSGGDRAIAMQNGGAAIITGNIIEGAATFGVQVSRNSFARVIGNTIRSNGTDGINVRLGAAADVFDNVITQNRNGIDVDNGGSVDISGNHILANREDGVRLRDNSNVRFSGDPDNATINVIELNGDNGVDCARGGAINGDPISFGAGNAGGNTNIAGNCQVQAGVLP